MLPPAKPYIYTYVLHVMRTMESRIESLTAKVTEAKELKETTQLRVAQAKVMLEEKKKEAKKVQQVVQQAEERKRYVVSQARGIALPFVIRDIH